MLVLRIREHTLRRAMRVNRLNIYNGERRAVDLGDLSVSKYARGVCNLFPSGCIVNPARVTRNPRRRDYKVTAVTTVAARCDILRA